MKYVFLFVIIALNLQSAIAKEKDSLDNDNKIRPILFISRESFEFAGFTYGNDDFDKTIDESNINSSSAYRSIWGFGLGVEIPRSKNTRIILQYQNAESDYPDDFTKERTFYDSFQSLSATINFTYDIYFAYIDIGVGINYIHYNATIINKYDYENFSIDNILQNEFKMAAMENHNLTINSSLGLGLFFRFSDWGISSPVNGIRVGFRLIFEKAPLWTSPLHIVGITQNIEDLDFEFEFERSFSSLMYLEISL